MHRSVAVSCDTVMHHASHVQHLAFLRGLGNALATRAFEVLQRRSRRIQGSKQHTVVRFRS